MTDQPLYLKEFPDYDDVLIELPGMNDTSWGAESHPQFTNEVAGLRLWCGYKNKSAHDHPDQPAPEHRFELMKVHDEFDISKDTSILATDDFNEICAAYAKAWIAWVLSDESGLIFHLDTPGDAYTEPLPAPLFDQYDAMRDFIHEQFEDPYAVCVDIGEEIGVYPKSAP